MKVETSQIREFYMSMSLMSKKMSNDMRMADDNICIREPIRCRDGFSMSVQASFFHYCTPRLTTDIWEYDTFEVGYPSSLEPLLMPMAEDKSDPTQTVYAQVPLDIILTVIRNHGGIMPPDMERKSF